MEALINQQQGTRLLRIDIDQWGSPVAKQYDINRLPTVWLYNGSQLVASDTRSVLAEVTQLK